MFRTHVARFAAVAGILTAAATMASAQEDAVKWTAATKATTVKPGASFDVQVTATMAEGWHLYSINQPPPPIATRITVAKGQPFSAAGDVDGPLPQTAFDQSFGIDTEFYADSAAFTLPVKAEANAPGGKTKVKVQAYFQSCNDTMCLPPKTVTMEVPIEVVGAAVTGTTAAVPAAAAGPGAAPTAPTATPATAAPADAP